MNSEEREREICVAMKTTTRSKTKSGGRSAIDDALLFNSFVSSSSSSSSSEVSVDDDDEDDDENAVALYAYRYHHHHRAKTPSSSKEEEESPCWRLEEKYTRLELKLAVLFTSQNIAWSLEKHFGARKKTRRCAVFLDASSAVFVTAILALMLLRVEFVCIEPPPKPHQKNNDDRDRKGREKVFRRFVREVAGCGFAVARASDGTYLEEILRRDEEEEEEEESFLVLTDISPALRAPLDEARMMSSSKGCQVGARDAFARKAMEDLNSLLRSSSSNNNSNDNAYVCFTSGTTGQRKGVKTTRENIDAYAKAKVKNEKLDSSSIVALVSAHVFDPCVGDIASAVVGKSAIATFSPRDELVRGGSRALRDALVASRATHVCCTPSFWEFGGMLDDDDGLLPLPEHLKSVSLGGEKMSKAIKDSFFKRESKVTLLNVYGVTEATVYQTSKKISSSSEEEIMRHKGATNIGTPLDESFASLVIVDRNDDDNENERNDSHEVAEDNIVGEIAIYGLGIPPEGYLVENNARRKAFRDVQFRGRNNIYERRRCYMTGDLGYFDSKTKEYYLLGRIESDRQVKIRGHRIELEGVESLMRERCEEIGLMPNVIEPSSILCFVDEIRSSSRSDVDDNNNNNNNNNNENTKEIVAFIKLVGENDEEDDDDEENRRTRRMDVLLAIDLNCAPWLLLSNNAAMMPSRFVFLEKDENASIPLSATGKRDFRAFYERYRNKERFYINLASSSSSSSNSERDEAAKNKDELETLVAKCWADSLSCGINFENIKRNDSFVRMGGNSMSALIACRKIREAMKKRRSTLLENSIEDKDDPNEPGVKKSEAGALLAPENIDNDEDNIDKRLCGAFLGVDGEGPLAPCELLRRPVLASYCAFLRVANFGLNAESASPKLSTSSSSSSTKEEQIHPDVLAAKAAVYRSCARGTDVALIRALVAPFANNAELLREILGNKNAANASTSEMRSENDDENLTALHVLTSRANVNEKYLSEKKVLPLVELLVLEYKANVLAQTRSGKTTPIHIAAARGCPNILKILYRALDFFDNHDDVSKKKAEKKELFFVKDVDEQTCLHLASRSGNSEAVRAVLDILFDGDHDDDHDDDNKKMSSLSLNILRATDAWNRTARDWAFFLGFSDVIEVFSSSSSRAENDNILLPVERELISLPSSSEPSSIQMISSNNRKMDVSSEYLDTLLKHLKKEDKTGGGTIENRIRAASGLRDALCANAKNRQTAFDRNVAKVLTETLVSSVSEAKNKTEDTLETTLLLNVIFCIRNAAGYGPSRKQFLQLDALRALASVVNGRRKEKEKEDNISWQALSAMIVLCRAKETKEGLISSMEMLKELGYGDVCRPIFERTRFKLKNATRDEM